MTRTPSTNLSLAAVQGKGHHITTATIKYTTLQNAGGLDLPFHTESKEYA